MQLLILDLDGTLIDSKLDLAHSVNAARMHLGRPPIDVELIGTYVGNGAPVLMRRSLGPEASQEDVDRALEFFLDYYREHMLDNTYLYPGVKPALDRFREAGVRMAVLTNKPVRFSRDLVAGLGLTDHFLNVYGGNSFEEKKPHPMGVDVLIAEAGAEREQTMMVGDSSVDIETARNAGIRCCGVTYGFQPEGFEQTPPDILVDSLEDLADQILAGTPPRA